MDQEMQSSFLLGRHKWNCLPLPFVCILRVSFFSMVSPLWERGGEKAQSKYSSLLWLYIKLSTIGRGVTTIIALALYFYDLVYTPQELVVNVVKLIRVFRVIPHSPTYYTSTILSPLKHHLLSLEFVIIFSLDYYPLSHGIIIRLLGALWASSSAFCLPSEGDPFPLLGGVFCGLLHPF